MSNNQKQEIMSVKITKNPTTGAVVTKSESLGKDGKQYGYIRIEESAFSFGSAVGNNRTKSALKTVVYDDAMKAVANGSIKEGMELSGKIVTIESLTQELGMKPKQAGKDGGFCQLDGKQIYFRTEYTEDVNVENVLIKHNSITEPVNADVASKAKLNS